MRASWQPSMVAAAIVLLCAVQTGAAPPWPTTCALALPPGDRAIAPPETGFPNRPRGVVVGGRALASVVVTLGRLTQFASRWLPEQLSLQDLRQGGRTAYELASVAKGLAAELWPDFAPAYVALEGDVTVQEGSGMPPIARVRLKSEPHPKLRLEATVELLAWSGLVVSFGRSAFCRHVVPIPVSPAIGERGAIAVAKPLAEAEGADVGTEPIVRLSCREGILVWCVGFGSGRTSFADMPERMWSVEVDATSGRARGPGVWEEIGSLAAALGRRSPQRSGQGAPTAPPGPADSAPEWSDQNELVFVSNRKCQGLPWWREQQKAVFVLSGSGLRWALPHARHIPWQAVLSSKRLFSWSGWELATMSLDSGVVNTMPGPTAASVSRHGQSWCVVRRDEGHQVWTISKASSEETPGEGAILARHRRCPLHLKLSPDGNRVAYDLGGRQAYLLNMTNLHLSRRFDCEGRICGFAWSPAGRRLLVAWASSVAVGQSELHLAFMDDDGHIEPVGLPEAVGRLTPADWAFGASDDELLLTGEVVKPMRSRLVYRWRRSNGEVDCLVPADVGVAEPYRLKDGQTTLTIVSEDEQRRWPDARTNYLRSR